MSASNLGVVFAPCLLYDPTDPSFGALSAPNAFCTLVENAELFVPHPSRAPAPAPIKKGKKRSLPDAPGQPAPAPQVVGPPPTTTHFPPPPLCVVNSQPQNSPRAEEIEKLKQELQEIKKVTFHFLVVK